MSLRNIKTVQLLGAVAGNLTVTGIKKGDRILSVTAFGLAEGAPNTFSGIVDLTTEFLATADNTINNTGGTSTAAKLVTVTYENLGGGRNSRTTSGRAAS